MAMLQGEMLEITAWSSIFFREAPLSEWPKRQESAKLYKKLSKVSALASWQVRVTVSSFMLSNFHCFYNGWTRSVSIRRRFRP